MHWSSNDPSAQYAYEDGADGNGNAKYVRLDYATYPNSRSVYYNYPASGVGGALSRLDNIAADGDGTHKYAQYTYAGAGTVVEVAHPAVGGDHLSLTYKGANPGPYDGFDRFGRVVDQKWQDTAGTPVVKDRFKYGYDLASNRRWRENALTHGTGNKFDEFYAYDGLDRLADSKRGTLTDDSPRAIDGTAAKEEGWTLDALGNWPGYVQKTAGTAVLEQTRVHNKVNEIHTSENHGTSPAAGAITEGQGQPAWQSPGYDAAGNMTAGPRPGSETTQNKYVYDAWNRLVKVTDANDVTIAEYRYNGLGRRIAKMVRKVVEGNERWDRTDYYYNESWQVVEERFGLEQTDKDAVATNVKAQYAWDIRYIDAPILRWRDADNDENHTLEETLYYTNDANMNVTALVKVADGAAHVVERYLYDPYGKVTVLNGESGYDADGQVTEWSVDTGGSDWANEILYCGYRFDLESGLYHVRHRYYHPTLGRWVSRDPAGYTLGMSLYEYCGSSPAYAVDPSGMQVFFPQYLNPRSGAATSSGGPGQQRVKLQGTWDADVGLNRGPGMAGLNISMHGDFKLDTKYASCCTKLDIIQTAETYVYNDLSILDAESDTHIDGTGRERPFYGFARPYNHREEESGPGFPAVDTHDDPGKALGWSATRELWQNFETCAVCTEGSEKGQVISCIYWGQHWRYEFKDADGTYVYTMSFYLLPEVRSLMVRLASTGQIKSSFVYDPELARKLKKNPGLAKDWIQYRGRGSAPSGDLLNLAGSKYYYVGQ